MIDLRRGLRPLSPRKASASLGLACRCRQARAPTRNEINSLRLLFRIALVRTNKALAMKSYIRFVAAGILTLMARTGRCPPRAASGRRRSAPWPQGGSIPEWGIFVNRGSGISCIDSGIVHLGAVAVALAIAWGVGGALTDAVGQPLITEDQRDQASDPSSLKPQSSQPAPVEVPSSGESSAPAGLSAERLCDELRSTALQNDLPAQFFSQLIWQESHFNTSSVSRAGAQGIAQFMPATAYERKLADPFEPIQALHEAARLLNELRAQFGNLGLAAAAYNAGPHRVRQWLAGRGHLPGETRAYVRAVTGHSVEDWTASRASGQSDLSAGSKLCSEIAGLISAGQVPVPAPLPASMSSAPAVEQTAAAPWGLQLIGDSSEVRALSAYRALQQRFPEILGDRNPLVLRTPATGPASWYRVRVAETTLQSAKQLCARLQSAGASCLVQRNQ